MRQFLLAASTIGAFYVLGVHAQDASCLPTCEGTVRASFADLGCASAADAPCLCAASGFLTGITQCAAPACSPSQDQITSYLNAAFCSAVPINAAVASSSTSSISSSSTSLIPTTTTAPAVLTTSSTTVVSSSSTTISTTSSSSTTTLVTSSSSSSSLSATSTTTQASTSSTTSKSTQTTSKATSTASVSSTASKTTHAPATTTSSTADNGGKEDTAPSTGLSRTAIIGIAVGCGAGLIAIIILAFCFVRRRRQDKQQPASRIPPSISKPIMTTSPNNPSYEKFGNDEFEMMTNRYEDMPPRQTPRNMV